MNEQKEDAEEYTHQHMCVCMYIYINVGDRKLCVLGTVCLKRAELSQKIIFNFILAKLQVYCIIIIDVKREVMNKEC